ncbi:MAG: nucleoside hydrolase [Proteobacteria bacterium]|jgi:pyrimidine-specific ribonucleoside hydrolase|nr:nucleoside hydrolase [Alphaproteobacteria bacterium]NCC03875.1 nucleoside hydrolase [Pseudomonadota bacterium]
MLSPFILDCDTGRDDALAILYALKKELPMQAVFASYGNTTLNNVVDNCLRVIPLGGGKTPVFIGEEHPLSSHPLYEDVVLPRQEQAGNGLCNVLLPDSGRAGTPLTAVERAAWIDEKARRVGPVDYYITGPATNFAAMLPHLASGSIRRVVMMAGRLGNQWAKMPTPDFNIACDPPAFQMLLESSFEIVLVPVNTTYLIHLSLPEINELEGLDDVARFSKELMIAHCRSFSPEPVFYFHDPSVLFALKYPASLLSTKVSFDANLKSPSFGRIMEVGESEAGRCVYVFEPDDPERAAILADILVTIGLSS